MWQFVHDYWAVAAVTAGIWVVLSCASGVVTFAVLAVRESGTLGEAVGGFRRMLTGKRKSGRKATSPFRVEA